MRTMRMLFLYRGWYSGINEALLRAWRTAMPELHIQSYDLDERVFGGPVNKIRALPRAVRRSGLGALRRGQGSFTDAVKRSSWAMRRLVGAAQRVLQTEEYDFCLSVGTVLPVCPAIKPQFVYTDHAIRTNLDYPDGEKRVTAWRECLRYEEDWLARGESTDPSCRTAVTLYLSTESKRSPGLRNPQIPQAIILAPKRVQPDSFSGGFHGTWKAHI